MHVRRWLCALLALALLASSVALAAPGNARPVNPKADHLAKLLERRNAPRPNAWKNLGLTIAESGEYLAGPTTWTVTPSVAGDYTYEFVLLHDDSEIEDDIIAYPDASGDNRFTFQLMVPGDYDLYIYVSGSGGQEDWTDYYFTVENPDYPTLDELVSGVVAECRRAGVAGEYATALWLHDWLLDNCTYDYTYSHYSADAALVLGTGVCDSYSKAYLLLLQKAGIEVKRVTGYAGENHAWNAARLEGAWTLIDPTWDDSEDEGAPDEIRAMEDHFYFGLPEALMRRDHTPRDRYPSCMTYDLHYFVHENSVSDCVDDLRALADDALSVGCYSIGFDVPRQIRLGGWRFSTEMDYVIFSMAAYILNRDGGCAYGGAPVDVDVAYSVDRHYLSGEVRFGGRVFALPTGLTEVGAEAFENVGDVMAVALPGGASSIGPRAFAGCGSLWKVSIPASVTSIDPTAFDGCEHVSIACADGSYAMTYAMQNHIHIVVEN